MKVYTSYFYQIRNFKPYMIPVSTALGDPFWYHNSNDNKKNFWDKRGILNGLRYEYIMVQKDCSCCPCKEKNPKKCTFLKQYKQLLDTLDFKKIEKDFQGLIEKYKKRTKIEEEPVIVLIVHEAWYNECSERKNLQDFFKKNGIDCKELEYPI